MQSRPLTGFGTSHTASHGGRVLSPPWKHLRKVRAGTCVESWVEQKARLAILPQSRYLALLHVCDEKYSYARSCESVIRLCGRFNNLCGRFNNSLF